ncbi:MAG: TonB-dependent receptor [Pseudomonadota bacterium]
MDKKFLVTSFVYAIVGLVLGIYMAASKDHSQFVTHAHIMLVGFLLSFIYGVCQKLWLGNPSGGVAQLQFYVHHASSVVLLIGLYLMFAGKFNAQSLGPVLGISSIGVLSGLLIMLFLIVRTDEIS